MNKKALKQFNLLCDAENANHGNAENAVWRVYLDGETSEQYALLPLEAAVELENAGLPMRSAVTRDNTAVAINDLHKYIGREVQYNTNCGAPEDDRWSPLVSITASPAQGANVNLADGTTLQACFATAVYLVKI